MKLGLTLGLVLALLSLDWVRGNVPYQTRELMDQFVEGLRRAGLR